ncbi:MAG: hypothetical protein ACFFD2_02915 [Promethearchaeota archaeon]
MKKKGKYLIYIKKSEKHGNLKINGKRKFKLRKINIKIKKNKKRGKTKLFVA